MPGHSLEGRRAVGGDFGAELARLMEERGVGVRALARRTYYNPGHISNLRSGKSRP